jgi:hypothetical protein
MKHLFFALALMAPLIVCAQKEDQFRETERIIRNAPREAFDSVPAFADWLRESYYTDEGILRGIFYWMGKSVSYDVENMYNYNFDKPPSVTANETFTTRKAICQGYSELFNELCRLNGITSFVVHGYSKQNGSVSDVGHAWIVAKVDGSWYCFDPTWGAGYVNNGKFYWKFSPEYFMVAPEKFITTHMPLDPMWQCLDHPWTIVDFYEGARSSDDDEPVYAFSDSISEYMQLTKLEQYAVTLRRLNESKYGNNVTKDYMRFLSETLRNAELQKTYVQQKQMVDLLNEAVAHYNSAAKLFNNYIDFYNRQFRPAIPDNQLRSMLDTCNRELVTARKLMREVEPFSRETEQNLKQLKGIVNDLQQGINKQELFLQKYLATAKANRYRLFRISN